MKSSINYLAYVRERIFEGGDFMEAEIVEEARVCSFHTYFDPDQLVTESGHEFKETHRYFTQCGLGGVKEGMLVHNCPTDPGDSGAPIYVVIDGLPYLIAINSGTIWKRFEGWGENNFDYAAFPASVPNYVFYPSEGSDRIPVATIDDVEITLRDVEEERDRSGLLGGERLEQLEKSLDLLLSRRLFELEAEASGSSVEALLQREVHSKVDEPTPEEVEAAYNRVTNENRTDENIVDRIREFLRERKTQEVTKAYADRLRLKHRVTTFPEALR